MYTSFGTLALPPVDFLDNTKRKKRFKRAQDRAAIKQFCLIANPSKEAYHPLLLDATIPQLDDFPLDFNFRAAFVEKLLARSYTAALEKHYLRTALSSFSSGPVPNRITYEHHTGPKHGRYILTWLSSMKELRLELFLYRGNALPNLKISGFYENQVKKRAQLAGTPPPIFDPKAHRNFPRKTRTPFVQPKENKLENLLDVKVPLGDLLDFLKKYETK